MSLRRLIIRAGYALALLGLASYATPPEIQRAFQEESRQSRRRPASGAAADATAFAAAARVVARTCPPWADPPEGHPERVTGRPLSAAERPLWAQLGSIQSPAEDV